MAMLGRYTTGAKVTKMWTALKARHYKHQSPNSITATYGSTRLRYYHWESMKQPVRVYQYIILGAIIHGGKIHMYIHASVVYRPV